MPSQSESEVYGHTDFFDGIKTRRLSIGVEDPDADIMLSHAGYVTKHPFDLPRDSTEEERAAVGWTW